MDRSSIYKPLDKSKNEIRLATILPAANPDNTISCTLSVVSLDDCPQYEALSYVWGDLDATTPILFENRSWQVTTNLRDALRQFRQLSTPRVVFVDALCINQDDLDEKTSQVLLMSHVYQQANTVRCWLGKEAEGKKAYLMLELLRLLGRGKTMKEMGVESGLIAYAVIFLIVEFLNYPYWKRAWIIQEVVLASNAVIHLADQSIWIHDLPSTAQLGSEVLRCVNLYGP